MSSPAFLMCAAVWLIDMALMAALAPLGANPLGYLILYWIGFGGMLAMVATFPPHIRPAKALLLIFALATVSRLLFLGYPVGNDVYRYVWEGAVQWYGYNPYAEAPGSPALQHLSRAELSHVWPLINHKGLPAVYPPLTLLFFRLLAYIQPNPLFFKWVITALDLAVLSILALLAHDHKRPVAWLLLYAANPLVLLYVSGEGHFDVLQAFWLLSSLALFQRGRDGWGFLTLGLAVTAKYLAIAALPFVISVRNIKKCWLMLLPLLLYWPYREAGTAIFSSLKQFSFEMHYNDSIFAVWRHLSGDCAMAWHLTALLLILGAIYLTAAQREEGVFLAVGCVLIFLPTLHPWYLLLMAPLMVLYPSPAWITLQAAMAFTFPVIGREWATGVFQEMAWVKWFIYLPFFGLLLWGGLAGGRRPGHRRYCRVSSVSVVVPALNEGGRIRRCLQSIRHQPDVSEVLVVDGGSSDDTLLQARAMGAKVLQGQKGRGLQIRQGVARCKGDVIIVLHADCILTPDTTARILRQLNRRSEAAGGAVRMQFAPQGVVVNILAFLNNLRVRLTGIAFGDQAQFFRSDALSDAGGFPPMMLMEDVEVSLRMKSQGPLLFVKNGVTVSSRRWRGRMRPGRVWLVLKLCGTYLLARRLDRVDSDNADYYRAYYGSDP